MEARERDDETADDLTLADAVGRMAELMHGLRDADLGQPFRWEAHDEGARFALLGAMHELRALAVRLAAERRRDGPPMTRAHHALAQYHAAYRDLEAAFLGVTNDIYDRPPAPGEWPLRYVHAHMVASERHFFSLVHYGLRRQREGGTAPPQLPQDEPDRLLGPRQSLLTIMQSGTKREMADFHAMLHDRALAEFAAIDDDEIDGPSVWWEGEPYTLEYRLHRMDAHLRQHTVQIDKTRVQLGDPPNEARRLLRLVYGALAEVEATLIGAPHWGAAERSAAAASINRLTDDALAAVSRAAGFLAALTGGDRERVAARLAEHPSLVNATSGDGVSATRMALYYGHREIAEMLAAAPEAGLDIWDAAALGHMDPVTAVHDTMGKAFLDDFSRDGYTPLQLACFFGREEVARYLVEAGADISAVAQNGMAIQPLHAATAGGHAAIVELLLAAGADPNAAQQEGFRPLHSAAQNGDGEIVRLLLSAGADPSLTDAKGRTPRHIAAEAGHTDLADLLSELSAD